MSGMQENIRMLMNNQLKLDDCYSFKCNKCGKCCTNHTGITLTPFDLWNIAKEMKLSVENVIGSFCIRYIGESSKIPIVALAAGRCPFVLADGCFLGDAKPVICKMYPLGAGFDGTKTTYFYVDTNCGEKDSSQTVEGWLAKNGLTEEVDEFRQMWYGLISNITTFIHKRNFSVRELDAFQTSMFVILYLCYDIDKPFYGQFAERAECVERIIQRI